MLCWRTLQWNLLEVFKNSYSGTSLGLRLSTSTAVGEGLIPGQGTNILYAMGCGQKKKIWEEIKRHTFKCKFKKLKQPFKASGNGTKDKQQIKKHLSKKVYKNLVRKAKIAGIRTNTTPYFHPQRSAGKWFYSRLLQSKPGYSLPLAPEGGLSSQEKHDVSVFHSASSYLLL